MFPNPPLEFRVAIDDKVHDFAPELQHIADEDGERGILDFVRTRANLRNRLLYATNEGIPRPTEDAASAITDHRNNIFSLLAIYVLVDTHPPQMFVSQCLAAFLRMLRRLPQDGNSSDGRPVNSRDDG
jgi:hypothetical protein